MNDTNGAGDMCAAAALSMIVRGFTHVEAARFSNYAAAQIVEQSGARLSSVESYQTIKSIYWVVTANLSFNQKRYRSSKPG